jgi:hypothetical protein
MPGEPEATEGPTQKPAESFQRQTGADIGSYSDAAAKLSQPFPRQAGGDVPSFSEAGKNMSAVIGSGLEDQVNTSQLKDIVGKPLTQEQAQVNTGKLIEKYLSTVKVALNPIAEANVNSAEEAPAMTADDMVDFVVTLKEKGVVSEEGAVRLSDNIKKYKETGNFPPPNTSSSK